MGTFHALNSGTSDCFVLQLEDGGRQFTALIDGGTLKDPRNPLPRYLDGLGVAQVDVLIVTHLHQDHIGYLAQVAASMAIHRAVVPYPCIPVRDSRMEESFSPGQAQTTRDYINLLEQLRRQKTQIYTTHPMTAPVFSFGPYRLRCIAPDPTEESPVWRAYREVDACTDPEQARDRMAQGRSHINADSSIWLLERDERPVLLLCGDCLDQTLCTTVRRCGLRGVELLKLSHHGRNDKGQIYYTAGTVGGLSPQVIVITADEAVRDCYGDRWRALYPDAQLVVTCDLPGAAYRYEV